MRAAHNAKTTWTPSYDDGGVWMSWTNKLSRSEALGVCRHEMHSPSMVGQPSGGGSLSLRQTRCGSVEGSGLQDHSLGDFGRDRRYGSLEIVGCCDW
jgi:hypothetical protein